MTALLSLVLLAVCPALGGALLLALWQRRRRVPRWMNCSVGQLPTRRRRRRAQARRGLLAPSPAALRLGEAPP